ncbi:unnamed protein product [Microthlaspi erraticum]|uniref:Endonuclease/exonuclease/phosphatase domain-containing protein n=1 Tax=Microthlaspi erraticum TaxID=1685480 RepID=A0A6D2J0H1_9BRAS|nr:unnamed protein product [Microthlaspi erraticum]
MIDDCGLVDFPSHGNILSWRGRRWGKIVRCRLDRALATEDWHDTFPKSHVEYLKMIGSDHRPILATIDNKIPKGRRQFRFDKRWIGQNGFSEAVERGWKNNPNNRESKLVDMIGNCRYEISQWRHENKPYGKDKIVELQKLLEDVQNDDNRIQEELVDITHN